VEPTSVTLDHFNLRSPLGEVNTSGKLDTLTGLSYNANLQTRVALAEVSRVLAPDLRLQGAATFNGNLNGDGAKYKINGALTAEDLTAAGDRLRAASVEDINI